MTTSEPNEAPANGPRHARTLALAAVFSACLTLGTARADSPANPNPPAAPTIRDVDLTDVKVEDALHLLAELYDTSIATGKVSDEKITVRLRSVGVDDAFAALAAAAGLKVERRGSVILVSPDVPAPAVVPPVMSREVVLGPFAADLESALRWLNRTGVTVERLEGGAAALIEGPPGDVKRAVAALSAMRSNSATAARANRIFRLGLADGEQTLAAVVALIDETTETATYDAVAHVLSVTASPSSITRVERLLEQVQVAPPQYEIEVRVVEVSKNALARIGARGAFRLNMSPGAFPTTLPQRDLNDSARFFPSANQLALFDNLASNNNDLGNLASDAGRALGNSGFVFGQVDGRGINLLIEYLEESGEAKVVATPKVTALDNRTAKVSMVTTLRIPTFTQNDAFATTTVSGIEEIDVGTTLEVRPRQTERGHVLLKVIPEVSEVSGAVQTSSTAGSLAQGLPIINRRRAETEVILASGETLVIGGLIRETESQVDGSVPGLSSLPLIGGLFKHKGKETGSTELLIFVTPYELPGPDERRDSARVDDKWIPRGLATRLAAARTSIRSPHAVTRLEGVRVLEDLDAQLMGHLLDVERDAIVLGGDPDMEVRRAAALFLIHRRSATALDRIRLFKDARHVAVAVLEAHMAPHLRMALAEMIAAGPGGVELIEGRLLALARQDSVAGMGVLLEALASVAPARAARLAEQFADDERLAISAPAVDALGGGQGWETMLERLSLTAPTAELREHARAALERTARTRPGSEAPRAATERAVAWAVEPNEIHVTGNRGEVFAVHQALEVLADKAPDFRHLVDSAFAEIVAGAPETRVDPRTRTLWLAARDGEPERLAHCLVRYAMPIFEARVRDMPHDGARSTARAVRAEINALERISGAPSSAVETDATVAAVLDGTKAEK